MLAALPGSSKHIASVSLLTRYSWASRVSMQSQLDCRISAIRLPMYRIWPYALGKPTVRMWMSSSQAAQCPTLLMLSAAPTNLSLSSWYLDKGANCHYRCGIGWLPKTWQSLGLEVTWLPHPMRRSILECPLLNVICTKSRCNFSTPMWVLSTLVTNMVYNSLLSSWSIQMKSYLSINGVKSHRRRWSNPTSHLVLTFRTCATLTSECMHGTRSLLIFPAFRTQRYMLSFIYRRLFQCVPAYPFSSYHANWSWPNFQTAWNNFKPTLRRAFAEGLDGYDVSRRFGTVTVFRPTLAEIEAGWKPKNAAHEEDDEEEDEELVRWYPIGRRVRIPDVWYVCLFVSIKKYLCWWLVSIGEVSFIVCILCWVHICRTHDPVGVSL